MRRASVTRNRGFRSGARGACIVREKAYTYPLSPRSPTRRPQRGRDPDAARDTAPVYLPSRVEGK